MLKKVINYLVEDLNVDNNTAVTLTITLLTFTLGFLFTWIASFINRQIKKSSYRRSLKIIIKDFFKSCKKQHDAFKIFSDQKGFLHGLDFEIAFVSNFAQNYLSSLDIQVFTNNFSIAFNKRRAKHISKLFEIIEITKSETVFLKEILKLIFERYAKHEKDYQEHLDNLRKLQDDLITQFYGKQVDEQLNKFIVGIIGVFKAWAIKGQKTEFVNTLDEIVSPILDLAKGVNPNPFTRIAIDNCLKCKQAFENMQKLEQMLKERISNSTLIYKRAYKIGNILKKVF